MFDPNGNTINLDNNYRYDEIGNLKHDSQGQIDSITWTMYGKIKKIIRINTSTKPDLEFNYDAPGNRISKIIKPNGSSKENGGVDNPALWTTTYYVRDAQGNIMTIYKLASPASATSFKVTERNVFGGSLLGTTNTEVELIAALPTTNTYYRTLGDKRYECSNHLGNVLTVFTDRKIPVTVDGSTINHYDADIVNTFDYTPYGSAQPGRFYQSQNSTRGFGNQEKDNEIYGAGNAYTAEYWEYDPRLGRRWDTDPVVVPSISPYAAFTDNPVVFNDPFGLDPEPPTGGGGDGTRSPRDPNRNATVPNYLRRDAGSAKKGPSFAEKAGKFFRKVGQGLSEAAKFLDGAAAIAGNDLDHLHVPRYMNKGGLQEDKDPLYTSTEKYSGGNWNKPSHEEEDDDDDDDWPPKWWQKLSLKKTLQQECSRVGVEGYYRTPKGNTHKHILRTLWKHYWSAHGFVILMMDVNGDAANPPWINIYIRIGHPEKTTNRISNVPWAEYWKPKDNWIFFKRGKYKSKKAIPAKGASLGSD